MPHVSRVPIFFKKGIRNARLATLRGTLVGDAAAAVIPLDIRFHTHTRTFVLTLVSPPRKIMKGIIIHFPFLFVRLEKRIEGPPVSRERRTKMDGIKNENFVPPPPPAAFFLLVRLQSPFMFGKAEEEELLVEFVCVLLEGKKRGRGGFSL